MKKSIIYQFIILIILLVNFYQVQAQTYTSDNLIGSWDFEAIVKHDTYISNEDVKKLSDMFKGAYFDFGDDDRHMLRFKNGYVIKGSYYYDWQENQKISIGTQQDGTEINGFMDSYIYQLIFIDKDHFLLKLYSVSFDDDALYQMKFKRFTF